MKMAYDATSFHETEDRAWILTQIAHLYLQQHDFKNAETYANGALTVFSNYHYGLAVLGQVRLEQKRYSEAVQLLRLRYAAAPHAENLYALAEGLELAGAKSEADRQFNKFQEMATAESNLADNANHELVSYFIEHAKNPAKALQ